MAIEAVSWHWTGWCCCSFPADHGNLPLVAENRRCFEACKFFDPWAGSFCGHFLGASLQLTVASQRWICDHPHHKPQGWS